MKHSLLGGLTVAVAMSVFGAPLPSYAQDADDKLLSQDAKVDSQHHGFDLSEADLLVNSDPSPLEISITETPPLAHSSNLIPASPANSDASPLEPADSAPVSLVQPFDSVSDQDLATVFPHALDENQAATVYLHSIPVITLVGGELATLGSSKTALEATTTPDLDPVSRANTIVARLSELAETSDPADIAARWDDQQQAYIISWNDEDLITVNSRTILPDTTQDAAEDTLQMANRLRRLLGDAPALSRVEGMPEPVSQPANRVGVVTSTLTGMASWYGPGFHGRRSASGEVFNQNALTAAHRTLPFGTQVRVTNLNTGQQVVVRINDRGPFGHGRIIDLSAAAASSIGLRASGVGRVQVDVLSAP
jgi:rare lipoprotein A